MPSRQDQLHSYQFTVQRAVAALVLRETDPAVSPLRRPAGAALASVLVAAIVLGGTALYGLFAGGGSKWRDERAVVVEKESGARFVYRDRKLHPVSNYASALLIIGADRPKTVLVSRRSIDGVPRGLPLGIPGAPDSLPAAGRLSTAPWTICSATGPDGTPPRSALLVGATVRDGRPLGDDAVLLRHPDGGLYLAWRRHRYRLRDVNRVLAALAATRQRAVPVAPALLNALPAGPDLAPLELPGLGEPSDEVPGADIGDVHLVTNSGGARQYVVVGRDGVAGITELQAGLLLARTGQGEPEPLHLGRFARLPKLPDLVPTGGSAPPPSPPRLVDADGGAVCGQAGDDGGVRTLRVGATVPDLTAVPATGVTGTPTVVADHVVVEPGRGAVVESVAAPGATGGAVSVVTDLGRRHVVTGTEVLGMLGYAGVRPVRLPAGLVSLVPAGSALDPVAAREVARPA